MNKKKLNKQKHIICKFNGVIKMKYTIKKNSVMRRVLKTTSRINPKYRKLIKGKLVRIPERSRNNMEMINKYNSDTDGRKVANALKNLQLAFMEARGLSKEDLNLKDTLKEYHCEK